MNEKGPTMDSPPPPMAEETEAPAVEEPQPAEVH